MTPRQLAEAASTITTGYGVRRNFGPDPRLATPEHECDLCGNFLHEGEVCDCQDEGEEEDTFCPECEDTGIVAFGHRCECRTRAYRAWKSNNRHHRDPDAI